MLSTLVEFDNFVIVFILDTFAAFPERINGAERVHALTAQEAKNIPVISSRAVARGVETLCGGLLKFFYLRFENSQGTAAYARCPTYELVSKFPTFD